MSISRRTFLAAAAMTGVAAAFPFASPAAASSLEDATTRQRQRDARVLTGRPSHNGWEMEKVADDRGNIHTRPVPGTPLTGVQMRMGEVETILVYVISRFHREVDELRDGDVVGWCPPTTVRARLPESNQASGTAIQLRPGHYPAGQRGGFFPLQTAAIREILADLHGVVRWGGDDAAVDEALFYLDVGPSDNQLPLTANRIRR